MGMVEERWEEQGLRARVSGSGERDLKVWKREKRERKRGKKGKGKMSD